MTAKEFLLNDDRISAKGIAKLMWPNNKHANTYLSKKLNDKNGLTWTDADEAKALAVFSQLKIELPSK